MGLGGNPPKVADRVLETLVGYFGHSPAYREGYLSWGIGAGKSFAASIANTYLTYCLLCLKDPQAYYGLAPGSTIAVVNFSVTAAQAKRVVFNEVLARIEESGCFSGAAWEPDPGIRSELRWVDKNIVIFPGNSKAQSAIGYNVFAAVIDEAEFLPVTKNSERLAGVDTKGIYDATEELYFALTRRLASRGNERWQRDAKILLISSPRDAGSFMQRQMYEPGTGKRRKDVYVSTMPTWEGAPSRRLSGETFTDSVCGEVPIEFQQAFIHTPHRARRDFGAVPMAALEGLFRDHDDWIDALFGNLAEKDNCFDENNLSLRDNYTHASPQATRYAHIDLAATRDAAGVALTYKRDDMIVAEGLMQINPSDFVGGEIDLSAIRDLLIQLHKRGLQLQVTYDGWQSLDSLQQLRRLGIEADYLSVDRSTEAYDTLLSVMSRFQLWCPPSDVLKSELQHLELVTGGQRVKVDHPPGGSKDVADALAGSVLSLVKHEILVQSWWRAKDQYHDLISLWGGVVPNANSTGHSG